MRRFRSVFELTAIGALSFLLIFGCPGDNSGPPRVAFKTTPVDNDGRPWRIACYEGGPFLEFRLHLEALVEGLAELGWIEPIELPEPDDPEDTAALWQFLCEEVESDYVEFLPDAYWSCGWNTRRRNANKTAALERLNGGDIDLMLAMGTWAGLDLATAEHSTPTVVMSVSDPVGTGIVESPHDSGLDHVHCKCDPGRYLRQIRLFHTIFRFERLGVICENTPDGKSYANLYDLKAVGRERGFEVVVRYVNVIDTPDRKIVRRTRQTIASMADDIDAFWTPQHRGTIPQNLPETIEPLLERKIPTWSQLGSPCVRRGVLMGVTEKRYKDAGLFHARVVATIFNGATPRHVEQVYEDPKRLVINLEVARRMGFKTPHSLIRISDETFERIEGLERLPDNGAGDGE